MGWLSGILSGYADRQSDIRKDAAQRDLLQQQQESDIYHSLLNSDDEKLQHYGATGILQMAQGRKRKGGLAGWMGEMESSPIFPVVQKYMRTPQTIETVTPGLAAHRLPQNPVAGQSQLPNVQPSGLVQSATSPTEGGEMATPGPVPPPTPPVVAAPPDALAANPETEAAPGGGRTGGAGASASWGAPPPPPSLPPMRPWDSRANAPPPTSSPYMRRVITPPPPAPPAAAPEAPPTEPAPYETVGPPEPPPPVFPASAQYPLESHPTASTTGQPASALTEQVAAPEVGRTDTSTYLPHLPSAADAVAANERAKVRGEIAGLQEGFRQQGDPEWQRKGIDAYMAQHGKAGSFRPINVERTRPDGTVEQDLALLNAQTGQVFMQDGVTPLPPEYRPVIKAAGAGRALTKREEIAVSLYGTGKPGEDPIALAKSLAPWQHAKVLREEGIIAAEAALKRAEAMADAPLTAQNRATLTTQLAADWRAAQKPLLTMQQEITKMNVGVNDYDRNPNAASQAVISTFNRILDPTSVVRESEYSRTPEGLGLIHRVQGMYEKLVSGGAGVPKSDLIGMAETARQFLSELKDFNDGEKARIEFRAQQSNIDTRGVFGNTVVVPPPINTAPGAPPPTTAPGGPPVPTARATTPPADGPGSGLKMRNGVLYKDGQPY